MIGIKAIETEFEDGENYLWGSGKGRDSEMNGRTKNRSGE